MLPKIKKRLKSFILEEEGRISKQSILKIGSVIAMSLLANSHNVLGQSCPPEGPTTSSGSSSGSCGCFSAADTGASSSAADTASSSSSADDSSASCSCGCSCGCSCAD